MDDRMTLIPDIMDSSYEKAIKKALEMFFIKEKQLAWPAAFSDDILSKKKIQLKEIDIIVLPLDRIGAPQGYSAAKVFIAYYSDRRENPAGGTILASSPHVIKIGKPEELDKEIVVKNSWNFIGGEIKVRFAIPQMMYKYSDKIGILIAPFTSEFKSKAGGQRHKFQFLDLWNLLHDDKELKENDKWDQITQHIRRPETNNSAKT